MTAPGPGSRRRLRLLHTSDLHLTGNAAQLSALAAVIDVARDEDVDAVLVAGDLFDHGRVPDDAIDGAVEQLGRLDRPVVVIPGNHDCVGRGSVYERADLSRAGDHVVFVGAPEGAEVLLKELGLALWCRGIEDHDPRHRPLAGYRIPPAGWWQVVVTHGHFVRRGEVSERSSQVHQDEIAALACDYVALGHWHHFLDVSTDGVAAYYCGSPTTPAGDRPTVNLVTLEPGDGARVDRFDLPLPAVPRFAPT